MVLCPVALAIGCRKCPVFAVCPLKSTIGDYVPPATPSPQAARKAGAATTKASAAKKTAAGKAKASAGRTAGDTGTRRSSRRRPS